jgi:hypothetical protein
MIVPTMNKEELAREIFTDFKVVDRKVGYLMADIERRAKKLKRKEYQKVVNYKSLNRNDWIIFLWYRKKQEPIIHTIVTYRDKGKYHAITVHPSNRTLLFFSSHFLDRYNKRFLQGTLRRNSELILEFVIRNPLIAVVARKMDNEYNLFTEFNDGFGLGYSEEFSNFSFDYMKTFISKDMLHSGQLGDASITSNILEKGSTDIDRQSVNFSS